MTNRNTTKRALFSSLMATLICVSMLIGTTFAWFTDTASTAVNKIQAGTLDVGLEMSNDGGTTWENAEGKTLNFIKATGHENEPVLWEPGCTYNLPELRVVNKGNLALKYKLIITGINGDAKLNEAIEWTINDADINLTEQHLLAGVEGAAFIVKGHMQETAGNEYQNLSIDGIGITVIATQDTVEQDSNDNQYDKDATYLNQDADGNWLINSAAEMFYFANSVNTGTNYTGKTVILAADIDLADVAWTPISGFLGTFDGNGKTISNLSVDMPGKSKVGLFGSLLGGNIKNLTVDGAYVYGDKYAGVIEGHGYANVTNCTVKNATVTATGKRAGAIVGFVGEADLGGTQIVRDNKAINCTIYVGESVPQPNNICIGTYNDTSPTATDYLNSNTAENCTFGLLVSDASSLIAALAAGGVVAINNDITADATKTAVADRINVNAPTTLNLDAKLIVPGELEPTANFAGLYIAADTVFNATENGGIQCRDKENGECGTYVAHINDGANVTVNGGTYYGGGTTFNVQAGTLTINGGHFEVTSFAAPYNDDFLLNCVDANYQNGTAKIIVKGGTFVNFDPSNNSAEGAGTNFVADGYTVVSEAHGSDIWYTVVPA